MRAFFALVGIVFLAACDTEREQIARQMTGGEPARGAAAIEKYGCGACHTIPGVRGANGLVGPPLGGIANRLFIAGRLENRPSNLMLWIQHPQHIEARTVMPEMGVTTGDARDIAAYLYTLH